MLRIALVGCGKIADDHAVQIRKIPGATIVAACDREMLMARQFADRFAVPGVFTDLAQLIRESKPDAVHITTPPQGHYALARLCLENGVSVYVEKPFTVTHDEAIALVDLAERNNLRITAGHDLQFSHVSRQLRKMVGEGAIGKPIHLESYYCYDLSDPKYARAVLGDRQHWIRRLPGGLLHNIISHGIARIAEYLTGDDVAVELVSFVSPVLQSIGETQIIDELRVILKDKAGVTAYFTFSSRMRPCLRHFRIYGNLNGLALDEDQQTLILLRGAAFKSYAERFLPPLLYARQFHANFWRNLRLFSRRDFHMKAGMHHLIAAFYESIRQGTPPPIPHRELLLTARVMDAIFARTKTALAPENTK